MKLMIQRRLFALVLAVVLIMTMLPQAFAQETQCLDSCTGDTHAEDCPNWEAPQPVTLTAIAVTTLPDKVNYTIGESLDVTGGVITLTFSNETTDHLTITPEMVTGFDSSEAGTLTLTVTHAGLTASYDITVTEQPAVPDTSAAEDFCDAENCTGNPHIEGCPSGIAPISEPTETDPRMEGCSTPGTSHLFFTWWDGTGHQHEATVELNSASWTKFYWYDSSAGTVSQVPYSELVPQGNIDMGQNVQEGTVGIAGTAISDSVESYILYNGSKVPVTVTLPGIAFYSTSQRSADTLVNEISSGSNTLYLIWGDDSAKPTGVSSEDVSNLNCTSTDAYMEVSFTAPNRNGWIEFSFTYSWGSQYYSVYVEQNILRTMTLTHNGDTVTIGMGHLAGTTGEEYIDLVDSDTRFSVDSQLEDSEASMVEPVFFAAFDSQKNFISPAELGITNIQFSVDSCYNTSGSSPTPNLYMEGSYTWPGEQQTTYVNLKADNKNLFDAVVSMSFQIGDDSYRLTKRFWREIDNVGTDSTESIHTTEGLNAILASNDDFFQWMRQYNPEQYNAFVNSSNSMDYIDLYLPAVSYGDIQCCVAYGYGPAPKPFNLRIHGSWEDDIRTSMTSLETLGVVWTVEYIDFVAGEGSTIAITPMDTDCWIPVNISDCTFTGYDKAIAVTGMGNVNNVQNCLFQNCTTGIYVNSADAREGLESEATSYGYNVFFENTTAVHIANLPSYVTAFDLRINRNIFLADSNTCVDFNVAESGKFFFQQNFYGNTAKDSGAGSNDVDYWFENHGDSNKIRTHARNAYGNNGTNNGTKLIANPFLKTINDRDVTAPALWLTNSATAPTEILASEVGGMPIDSDALNQNDGEIHVSILDNSGQSTIAQWSFNGGTGSDPQQ